MSDVKKTIIVYIDNKAYHFQVDVDHKAGTTTYYVSSQNKGDFAPVPDKLEFNEDGEITLKERLKTVEEEQIARLVWQEIINKMKP